MWRNAWWKGASGKWKMIVNVKVKEEGRRKNCSFTFTFKFTKTGGGRTS
jgi:hypothetical protein